jgi:hypothetical protein
MNKELTAEDIEAAFAAAAPATNTRKCSIGNTIEQYPVLAGKIMDVEHYSAKTVSKVLRGLGVSTASDGTVTKHRKGDCCCPKETS